MALERQLITRQAERTRQRTDGHAPQSWWNWLARWWVQQRGAARRLARPATIALALLAALILAVAIPFLGSIQRLGGRPGQLSALGAVARAYAGIQGVPASQPVLSDVSFSLQAELPTVPARLTVYRQVPDPVTQAEAEALAARFGLEGPAYRKAKHFVVESRNGRLQVSAWSRSYFRFDGSVSVSDVDVPEHPDEGPQQAITPAYAAMLAERFLLERGLLDFEYTIQTPNHTGLPDGYQVHFRRMLDGRPIENTEVIVAVDAGIGKITRVTSRIAPLEPVADYPIRTPLAAYQALQQGDQRTTMFDLKARDGRGVSAAISRETISIPEREMLSPYLPGDHVVLEGRLATTVRRRADDRAPRIEAWLLAGPHNEHGTLQYRLVGPNIIGIDRHAGLHVRVRGTVVPGDGDELGILVENYEKVNPDEQLLNLWGRPILEDSISGQKRLVLETEDGTRYALSPMGFDQDQIDSWMAEGVLDKPVKMFVKGTLMDQRSPVGYPVLEVGRLIIGDETGIEATLSGERQDAVMLTGEVLIDQIQLVYHAIPLPPDGEADAGVANLRIVQPVYVFVGHTANREAAFRAYVQAIRVRKNISSRISPRNPPKVREVILLRTLSDTYLTP